LAKRKITRETQAGAVKTPCVLLCKLEEGYCTGCKRTVDQIRYWSIYSDEQREQIISELCTIKSDD
jgi:predicted Fe-S protein YdhL (DUF1289 family)